MTREEYEQELEYAERMIVLDSNHSMYWSYYIYGLIDGFFGAIHDQERYDEILSLKDKKDWNSVERYSGYMDGLKKAKEIIPFTII